MQTRVGDFLPARRDILRLGGYGLLGAFADHALMPIQARALPARPIRAARRALPS
jgi:hypothetical protein